MLLGACASAPTDTGMTDGDGMAVDGGTAGGAGIGTAGITSETTGGGFGGPGPEPGTQEDLVTNVGDRVFFDFDRYDLRDDARRTIEGQADWLQRYPQATVVIEGHADERGTREYNLALGERRANSVRSYLIALGVRPDRVSTVSYGKERPAVIGSNEAAWAQNRRAVTVVGAPRVF